VVRLNWDDLVKAAGGKTRIWGEGDCCFLPSGHEEKCQKCWICDSTAHDGVWHEHTEILEAEAAEAARIAVSSMQEKYGSPPYAPAASRVSRARALRGTANRGQNHRDITYTPKYYRGLLPEDKILLRRLFPVCGLCHRMKSTEIEHCHVDDQVRGVACLWCNRITERMGLRGLSAGVALFEVWLPWLRGRDLWFCWDGGNPWEAVIGWDEAAPEGATREPCAEIIKLAVMGIAEGSDPRGWQPPVPGDIQAWINRCSGCYARRWQGGQAVISWLFPYLQLVIFIPCEVRPRSPTQDH
jgi:recombination endonuclease VII